MGYTYLSYADAPFMGWLPTGITNFGGDTQIFTIPLEDYQPFYMYLDPLAQMALNRPVTYNMYPGVDISQITANAQAAVDAATAQAMTGVATSTITRVKNSISALNKRLDAMLIADGVTEEQKEQINKLLEELKEQEDKLNELMESTDLTPSEAYKQASAIENAVREIAGKTAKIQVGEKVDGDTDSDTDIDNDVDTDSVVDKNKEKTNKTNSNVDEFSTDVVDLVDEFDQAVHYTWGTDNKKFEHVLNSLNENNIMSVLLAWNKYKSGKDNESFMEAFMWDANHSQKRDFGRKIMSLLRKVAEKYGVYEQLQGDFAIIDKELDAWFISNDISANFDKIVKVIAQKMGSKYGEPVAKSKTA